MALGFTAHSAPIAFLFYEGDMFPDGYRNDAFAAFRGSWNRKPPTGYKVLRVEFDENGEPTGYEDFLAGFLLDAETDRPKHFDRPAGLAVLPDGSLLVSDDANGVIYRVSHGEEPREARAAR